MMLYCLGKYPSVYEKVKNEIDENIDNLDNVDYSVFKNKLTYTSGFLNEVLRFYPPLPSSAPRKILKTFKVEGITFPKGAGLVSNY